MSPNESQMSPNAPQRPPMDLDCYITDRLLIAIIALRQSLEYKDEMERYSGGRASFEEIAEAMGSLVKAGKIRGWGMCNDNAYGLTASCYAARTLGVAPPVVMQNDYSLLNRRIEENGLSEASAAVHENVGFMACAPRSRRRVLTVAEPGLDSSRMSGLAFPPCISCDLACSRVLLYGLVCDFVCSRVLLYGVGSADNALAGGVLTGKYLDVPAAVDERNANLAQQRLQQPRGRMDERGWGSTLYRYRSGPATEAARAYEKLAKKAGMPLTELALRFCRARSPVTTTLLGTSNMAQVR